MEILEKIIKSMPDWKHEHPRGTHLHDLMSRLARLEIDKIVTQHLGESLSFPIFGGICLPYFRMGEIDSLDLLAIDGLMIYSFYSKNKEIYKKS